jgi:nucleoside-diphosphate-sugar epimerase
MARIFIAGANGKVGQALLPRLRAEGHRLVALVRDAEVPLAHEVVRRWTETQPADLGITADDVVVNLTGDINPSRREGYDPANVETALHLARLTGGKARQAVFISFPGARIGAANRYLDAKGRAEGITLRTARRAAILRTVFVTGTPQQPLDSDGRLQTPPGKAARSFGTGQIRARPLLMSDVVEAICGTIANDVDGAFALEGREQMTFDQLVRTLNRDPRKPIRHLARPLALLFAGALGLQRDFVRVFLEDQLCTDPCIFNHLGVAPASVSQAWT